MKTEKSECFRKRKLLKFQKCKYEVNLQKRTWVCTCTHDNLWNGSKLAGIIHVHTCNYIRSEYKQPIILSQGWYEKGLAHLVAATSEDLVEEVAVRRCRARGRAPVGAETGFKLSLTKMKVWPFFLYFMFVVIFSFCKH